jgi:hypothetical protein
MLAAVDAAWPVYLRSAEAALKLSHDGLNKESMA